MIHMDNACSHTAEYIKAYIAKSPFTQIKYPTYYPDLVSSDFFLFGALKRKIKCNYAKSSEELQELVERALNSFNPFDLQRALDGWEQRLKTVIRSNGSYI
ncbi:MAG: hypothetical protein EZS28_024552 [Streblomastix strix]|uniref:Tc1-like transposase DDE domain-containing protein n=1 Tax=Streblomastix strix TaxID=222440 RepID=A0A5J4VBL9_9EUKA|nr:MAG: hypothetical protein EZS28_024552 [Streblomastix strix]